VTTSFFGEECEVIEVDNYNLTHKASKRNGHSMLKGSSDISQTKMHFVICIHALVDSECGFVTIRRFEGYLIVA